MTRSCIRGELFCRSLLLVLAMAQGEVQANEDSIQLAQELTTASPRLAPISSKGVNPFDPIALNNKAIERLEQNDYRGALILLDRALRLAPNNRQIKNNYSRLKQWLATNGQPEPEKRGPSSTSSGVSNSIPASRQTLPPEPPAPWQ